MADPPRRPSYFVIDGVCFLIGLVLLSTYGWIAMVGASIIGLANYVQGLDRGSDIERARH
jgi:hypothetical protein